MEPKFLTLPVFPLQLVVLPGETLVLHVFEDRYKELVNDCLTNHANFGIPFVQKSRLSDFGTEVSILKILRTYTNGEMDIEVKGISCFKIIHFTRVLKPKLYGAASIELLEDHSLFLCNDLLKRLKDYFQETKSENISLSKLAKISLLNLAIILNLSPEEKIELIKIPSLKEKEVFLLTKMKFLAKLLVLEKSLGNKFSLN